MSTEISNAPAAAVRETHRAVSGHLHGISQPFLEVRLSLSLPATVHWNRLDPSLRALAPEADDREPPLRDDPLEGMLDRIGYWSAELQRAAGDVVLEPARVLWRSAEGEPLVVMALPTADPTVAAAALRAVLAVINRFVQAPGEPEEVALPAKPHLATLARKRTAPSISPVTLLFIEAARKRGIPWSRLGGSNVFQFGHGARSRWLRDAFTDRTTNLGAQIARNKAAAAAVLRPLGFPMPEHVVALDEEMALTAAETLGYPLVAKPLDLDMGIGVRVGLKDAAALRHAFAEARRHSERVLIERHVDGRDFRLTCFEGNLIGAVERVPGGVLGDGRSSVAELVERLNADPERGNRFTATLKKLKFDVEAEEQLAAAGLTAASIPRKGQWVRLRGPANLARGGSRIDVMDQVHPDNRRLAEQAARALRLDIAGVDLITPDIGRSWLEGGVHLTEVNAQPDLLTTLPRQTYGLILERLIAGEGRIPIGVILGGGTEAAASELAARILGAAGLCVGVASASGTLIGEERFGQKTSDVAIAARALLGDTRVEACVVSVTDASVGRSGLPFDRCGVVALAGSSLEQGSSWRTIAEPLLPMSRGLIAINAEDEQCVALSPGAGAARVILYARAPDCPALVAHRAAGGPAVWLQGSEVAIQTGAGAAVTLQLGGADAAFGASLGDILLAVAVAGSLGCGEQQLRQALAQVRLEA